jgi:hypothetical protein
MSTTNDSLFTPQSGPAERFRRAVKNPNHGKTGLVVGITAVAIVVIVVVIVLSIYLTKKNASSSVGSSAASSVASAPARWIPSQISTPIVKKPLGDVVKAPVKKAEAPQPAFVAFDNDDDSDDVTSSGFLPMGDDNGLALLA